MNKNMKRNILLITILIILNGCTTLKYKSIPDNYTGPLARVTDSYEKLSGNRVYFFELEKADGRVIRTSSTVTHEYNLGKDSNTMARRISRKVPAGTTTLTITGVNHMAPIIPVFLSDYYSISGEITVDLEEDMHYYVKGILSKKYSAIWLEDADGNIISRKIEENNH